MANNQFPVLKPKALKKNSRIGLIAPAGPINESQLAKAQDNLLEMGFRSCFTDRILHRKGYLAGEDSTRLDDLHEAFENNDIDAILCIRGGYGSARIIDQIDFELIKQNPKIFIGYSDITALLNIIRQKTGLICFHGVVGTSAFSEYTKSQFQKLFFNQVSDNEIYTAQPTLLEVLNKGKAKGQLVGGNLAIINSLLATPFELDFTNKIVFLEDVGETPYKIDRMLTQLLLSGNLQKAAGIILGTFKNCDIDQEEITPENSLSLIQVFEDKLKSLDIPVISNFSFGHIKDQAIFPIGIEAEIDTTRNSIRLLESVFKTEDD